MVFPCQVLADQTVNIYFFKQNGCYYCNELTIFFERIEEEYGFMYNLIEYNVSESSENLKLLKKVKRLMKESQLGLPYIVIGKKSFLGFKNGSDQEILSTIHKEYKLTQKYDVMAHIRNQKKCLMVIISIGWISFGSYFVFYIWNKNKQSSNT